MPKSPLSALNSTAGDGHRLTNWTSLAEEETSYTSRSASPPVERLAANLAASAVDASINLPGRARGRKNYSPKQPANQEDTAQPSLDSPTLKLATQPKLA